MAWTLSATTSTLTGSISGDVLTVTAPATNACKPGLILSAATMTTCAVVQQLSGPLNGAGTYKVSVSQPVAVASTTITATLRTFTQSAGVYTDHSSLVGLPGVTRFLGALGFVIVIEGARLFLAAGADQTASPIVKKTTVSGVTSIVSNGEKLLFVNAPWPEYGSAVGSKLRVAGKTTGAGGLEEFTTNVWMETTRNCQGYNGGDAYTTHNGCLFIAGEMFWEGGTLLSDAAHYFSTTSSLTTNWAYSTWAGVTSNSIFIAGTFVMTGPFVTTGKRLALQNDNQTLTGFAPRNSATGLDGQKLNHNTTLIDYQPSNNEADIWLRNYNGRFLDGCSAGMYTIIQNPAVSSTAWQGVALLVRRVAHMAADTGAQPVADARVWSKPTDDGNRINLSAFGPALAIYDFTNAPEQTWLTNIAGSAAWAWVKLKGWWVNDTVTPAFSAKVTRFTKGGDDTAAYEFFTYAYGYLPTVNLVGLNGIGTFLNIATMTGDIALTNFARPQVAAYTMLNTAAQWYDYQNYYVWLNPSGQRAFYCTKSGDVLNFGSWNIVLDPLAAQNWTVSGNTITVKSGAFAGSITSTGNITSTVPVNGALSTSAGVITSLASNVAAVDLTGEPARWDTQAPCVAQGGSAAAGTKVKITSASSGAVADFRAFGFASGSIVENTSGQPVVLRLSPGQTQPVLLATSGALTIDITTSVTTTLPGLVAGMEVFVFATGTQTVIASTTDSGTSFAWTQAITTPVTVDYTIFKDGYLPVRVTGVTISATATLPAPALVMDRAFQTPSGLSFGSTATVDLTTRRFAVTVPTTVQNWYSFMVQSWRTEAALKNKSFPLSTNGPNSFTLADWEFEAGVNLLSRDGIRYTSGGVMTAAWLGLYAVDTATGLQARYQQVDGASTTAAQASGKIDQLVQIYGDASHGAMDRRNFLVAKVQKDGFDQAEADVVATYGALEDQFYVIGLNPANNGLPTGLPVVAGAPSITDHGSSPVTWHGLPFSITITDSAEGNSGQALMRWIRYNLGLGGVFEGKDAFNWHDLVQTNGGAFKTVRGVIYGDSGAALKGVRVITATGADHPDFSLHTADDGGTYVPVFPRSALAAVLADSRVQLFNVTTGAEIDNVFVTGTAYAKTITTQASVGDTLRLRVCKKGYEGAEGYAVWAASGATFLVNQSADAAYAAWGIDGASVTEFALDGPNLQIDANDVDGETEKVRLGAFFSFAMTTELGIRSFFNAVTFLSAAQIRVNVDKVDMRIDNVNAAQALRFTDLSVRLFRSDGTSIIAPSSKTIHNDYNGVPDVVGGIPTTSQIATAVVGATEASPVVAKEATLRGLKNAIMAI